MAQGERGAQFALELFSGIGFETPFFTAEAVGEKGTLCGGAGRCATVGRTAQGAAPGTLYTGDMAAGEMQHFLDCIAGREEERCSLADMAYVAACIEAVRQSISTGLPVALGEGAAE